MATIQRKGDVIHGWFDKYTGESCIYKKITRYPDGSPMNDGKCDGVMWRKLTTNGVIEYFQRKLIGTSTIHPKWYGIVGDGITNDSAGVIKLFAALRVLKLPLVVDADMTIKYNATSELILPPYGVNVSGKITGARVVVKEVRYQYIQALNCDDFRISGVWYSVINNVDCRVLTVDSSILLFGTYWNTFMNFTTDNVILDIDLGSVNHNRFINFKVNGQVVDAQGTIVDVTSPSYNPALYENIRRRGGVLISGGKLANAPYNECHNNVFFGIDSSSHGFGGTDIVILNSSLRQQTNELHNLYAEGGSPFIVGNWHIFGNNIDHNGNALRIGHMNHSLFAGTHTGRNAGDFFSATNNNLAVGGDWSVVDEDFTRPYCLSWTGYLVKVPQEDQEYSALNCPSGINKQVTRMTLGGAGSEYQSFDINFNFGSPQKIIFVMWYKGDDFVAMETDDGSNSIPNGIYEDPASGWKLLRIVGINVKIRMRFYLTTNNQGVKKTAINSVYATNAKAVFMPSPAYRTSYEVVINSRIVKYNKVIKKLDGSNITDADVNNTTIKKAVWGEYFEKDYTIPTFQQVIDMGAISDKPITVPTVLLATPSNPDVDLYGRNQIAFARNEDVLGDFPAPYMSLSKLNDLRIFSSYTISDRLYVQRFSDVNPNQGGGWQTPRKLVQDVNDFVVKGIPAVAPEDFVVKSQLLPIADAVPNNTTPAEGNGPTADQFNDLLHELRLLKNSLITSGRLQG